MPSSVAAAVDLASVDLSDVDLFADGPPHELFARMRAEAPVHRNPTADGDPFWSLTRAEEFLAVDGPSTLAVRLPAGYTGIALEADTSEGRAKVEQALQRLLKRPIAFRFERVAEGSEAAPGATATPARRRDEHESDPLVRKVVELFEARPLHLE